MVLERRARNTQFITIIVSDLQQSVLSHSVRRVGGSNLFISAKRHIREFHFRHEQSHWQTFLTVVRDHVLYGE